MNPPSLPNDPNLLEMVLQPLLEDFQHWFTRSRSLLESEQLDFLGETEQQALLDRVLAAQREVSTTQSLFSAMGAQVGVSMATILPWHQLVTECWQVSIRYRQEQTNAGPSGDRPNQSLDTE